MQMRWDHYCSKIGSIYRISRPGVRWQESTVKIKSEDINGEIGGGWKRGWMKGNICHLYGDKCQEASRKVG